MADVTEREAYLGLINALKSASEFSRILGLKRGDMRWIRVRGMLDQCGDNCTKLFHKAQSGNGIQH